MEKDRGKDGAKGNHGHKAKASIGIAVTLAHNLNCSINEAWDMRYAEALLVRGGIIAEQNGADISISYDINFRSTAKADRRGGARASTQEPTAAPIRGI